MEEGKNAGGQEVIMINPVTQLVIDAYRGVDVNSDPQRARVVQLWQEIQPGQVSHNTGLFVSSDSGRFIEYFNSHPEELIKNLKLIERHLELKTLEMDSLLPLLLDKLSTKDLTAVLGSNELPIARLTKSQILRLSIFSNVCLPPYAQQFRQILQQPKNLGKGIQNIREIVGLTDEEKDAAIAHYIEHHNIMLRDLKLTNAEFLRLAPHLRYVNLRHFADIPLAKEILQKCSNLNVLLVNKENILKGVTVLPFCEKLNCSWCKNLQALPALPLCKELACNHCTGLKALPPLPLCEWLYCFGCSGLQALPALPLCKDLNCFGCTSLLALPALPLCEKLHCYSCTGLQALLALPLCKELDCHDCMRLQTLPALPLCEMLRSPNCIGLQELPALPICENLQLWGCANLTTLPLSLGQNSGLTHIEIEGTRIDPAVRDAILNQCRRMRDADAAKILPSRLAKWKAIANTRAELDISALSDEQMKTLNEWLIRLERTKDFSRSQTLLATTVCNILADLLKNKEFQELFFPQAEANNACCEDRAAMSLNEIYTSWKIICTPETLSLSVMTGIAKTLRLRKELQKLIRGNEGESVEIFLYYESTLRERLNLVTAIQSMTYGTIGNRNWINIDKLVEDVEANFFDELFELPVFEKMIVFDESEFSTQLENLGECPPGGPNDPDVLNYQHRQGEIMQEWKREKKRVAKKWYDQALS